MFVTIGPRGGCAQFGESIVQHLLWIAYRKYYYCSLPGDTVLQTNNGADFTVSGTRLRLLSGQQDKTTR